MPNAFETNQTIEAIDQSILSADASAEPRGHLGMSGIAGDARASWLQFRWSLPVEFSAQMLRIFQLGHILEDYIAKLLIDAGFDLHTEDAQGQQFSFSELGGHYSGSMDGAISCLSESAQWHVWECKTVNDAGFKKLKKDGVKDYSPIYYGQMQCYMHHSGMKRALFTAINKNNCEIYVERVKVDPMFGPAMIEKAREIITGDIPESSYRDRSWFEIKNFKTDHYQSVYWGDELPPKVSCRNCRFAVADIHGEGAQWGCRKKQVELSIPDQRAACDEHNFIQSLVNAKGVDIDGESVTYQKDDYQFENGPDGFSSAELVELSRAGYPKELMSDPQIKIMRDDMGGEIKKVEAA